ncbi:MAG: Rap1a/Tai family immunity protein [Pseudomonadota bacterium]
MRRISRRLRRAARQTGASALIVLGSTGGGAMAADEQHFMIDTAADLARLCASPSVSPNHDAAIHMCQGYIVGVHHFHEALAAEMNEGIYCVAGIDPLPSRDVVMAAFVSWVDANPEMAEREAMDALLTFAAENYPCS